MRPFYILILLFIHLNSNDALPAKKSSISNLSEATCVIHKYTGNLNNSIVVLNITSATYNGLLSLKGKLRGYYQFKNQVCSLQGDFKLNEDSSFDINLYSLEEKCPIWFEGHIDCHKTGSIYSGLMVSPGQMAPNYDEVELRSND